MPLRSSALRVSSALFAVAVVLLTLPTQARAANTNVRITTDLGVIDIQLLDSLRPVSVNNFLNHVNAGDYEGSFIHRSAPGFVIQGGGFRWVNGVIVGVPPDPVFQDIPGPSNLRGTIAMAEANGDATSQWFINLVDNPFLDANFTVFGEVTAGLDVIDQLALIPVFDGRSIHSAFGELPLINFVPPTAFESNFVKAPITLPEPAAGTLAMMSLATLAALASRDRKLGRKRSRA